MEQKWLWSIKIEICIIGSNCTGKSSILLKYFYGRFSDNYAPTSGINSIDRYVSNYHTLNYSPFLLKAWELETNTLNSIRLRNTSFESFQNISALLFIFSVTDRNSFQDVRLCMNYIYELETSSFITILIGNKCDLKHQREVSYEEAKMVADEYGILYVEVSAKTGFNIEKFFRLLCESIHKIRFCKKPEERSIKK